MLAHKSQKRNTFLESLRETFKEGDIVWAEWKDLKLKTNVGVVVGIHPPPYMYEQDSKGDRVLVKLPGYVSERAFLPDTECRHATPEEIKTYFKDKLKYGG
jgi:hypothetical protein